MGSFMQRHFLLGQPRSGLDTEFTCVEGLRLTVDRKIYLNVDIRLHFVLTSSTLRRRGEESKILGNFLD